MALCHPIALRSRSDHSGARERLLQTRTTATQTNKQTNKPLQHRSTGTDTQPTQVLEAKLESSLVAAAPFTALIH